MPVLAMGIHVYGRYIFFFFIFHSFLFTGVNSFQVYMAYKDYYQMSNSEVKLL